jgi:hypothetical protein
MFDEKVILARLQNGEDAQTIANEMAAMINTANKMYADQKAAEEAAKAEAAKAVASQKKEDLQEILDMFATWLGEYYGIEESLPADQVIDLIDSLKEYVEAFKGLEAVFGAKKPAAPIGTKIIKSNTKPANADETISAFLNKMGW